MKAQRAKTAAFSVLLATLAAPAVTACDLEEPGTPDDSGYEPSGDGDADGEIGVCSVDGYLSPGTIDDWMDEAASSAARAREGLYELAERCDSNPDYYEWIAAGELVDQILVAQAEADAIAGLVWDLWGDLPRSYRVRLAGIQQASEDADKALAGPVINPEDIDCSKLDDEWLCECDTKSCCEALKKLKDCEYHWSGVYACDDDESDDEC